MAIQEVRKEPTRCCCCCPHTITQWELHSKTSFGKKKSHGVEVILLSLINPALDSGLKLRRLLVQPVFTIVPSEVEDLVGWEQEGVILVALKVTINLKRIDFLSWFGA